jgi:hypothetical protein
MKLTIQTCGGQAIELTGAEARDVFEQLRALLGEAAPFTMPAPWWQPYPLAPYWVAPITVGDVIPDPYTITCVQ